MTLSLLTPSGAITAVAGGTQIVRCSAYPGAARGSLSTSSDADSVSGTVVVEEQELAVQTTFVDTYTLWYSADNSVSVPFADIGLIDGVGYRIFVGMKVEGAAPSDALAYSTWLWHSKEGASIGMGYGQDDTVYEVAPYVAKSVVTEYLLYDLDTYYAGDFPGTDFQLRGWGISGGTTALKFDLIYFIPEFVWDEDLSNLSYEDIISNNPEALMPLTFGANGTVPTDQDDASIWMGDHSVLQWVFPWTNDIGVIDFQESADEPTTLNANGNGSWPTDPVSYLVAPVGSVFLPEESLISDTFAEADGTRAWRVDDYSAWTGDGTLITQFGVPWTGGRQEGGNLVITLPYDQTVTDAGAECIWGQTQQNPGFNVSDPSTYHSDFKGESAGFDQGDFYLPGFVSTTRVSLDTVQEQYVYLGWIQNEELLAARAALDGSGNITLQLITIARFSPGPSPLVMDVATNVITGYSSGDWLWMKFERRGYHHRAKIWEDGDPEPGSWTVEGYEPISGRNSSASVFELIPHPYDTNWSGNVDHDVVEIDPRRSQAAYFGFSEPMFPFVRAGVGISLPTSNVTFSEFNVDWDPDGTTPKDFQVIVQKYDGTPTEAPLTVPYGAHRVVYGNPQVRRYNGDTDGFNMLLVKDASSPLLQTVGVYGFFERQILGPIFGSIKYP